AARMHEPRGSAGAAGVTQPVRQSAILAQVTTAAHAPAVGADSAEVTALDGKMLAKQPMNFVIEGSTRRSGDDDPTTLVVRDELKPPKGDTTSRGVGPSAAHKTPTPERQSAKQLPQPSAGHTAGQRGDEATPT